LWFVNRYYPWFRRSGVYTGGVDTGVFVFFHVEGTLGNMDSFRWYLL